jgi:hypothetical protein
LSSKTPKKVGIYITIDRKVYFFHHKFISITNGMITEELTKSNIMIYAMANYNTQYCLSLHEFKQDMKMFKKLNTQLSRGEDVNIKSALNLAVILNNQFTAGTGRIVVFYLSDDNYSQGLAILDFLNILPKDVDRNDINTDLILRLENITR